MTAAVLLDKRLLDRVISRMRRAQDAARANTVVFLRGNVNAASKLKIGSRRVSAKARCVSYDE